MKKLIISIISILFIVCSCDKNPLEPKNKVIYRVYGSAAYVDITLNNSENATEGGEKGKEHYNNVSLPVEYEFLDFKDNYFYPASYTPGLMLYLSVTNISTNGTINAEIYLNDKLVAFSNNITNYIELTYFTYSISI